MVTTALHQFAESLGNAIDAKDPHTSMHSDEVAEVARVLALAMNLTPSQAAIIHVAGHLHDIGKIGVPDSVLKKQGPLTTVEWRAVHRHPEAGAAILEPVSALKQIGVVDMVLHHHERWDGKGYPHALKGAAIPLGARIISVADSLSAMRQNRPYRDALDMDRACREIERCAGTQFDPAVVAAFHRASGKIQRLVGNAARW
ncbi:HD-GYP domain-containing protein [uncultured Pseudodesulfovibrio sp.]|uniref:HD-GYP domain-containing protein n=1 Tax=uncultured Pseudodesulfovibrio sp. TaxID=2035858 RepID=UPI0029C78DF4|nr:HD-GYP domain-containing protein [uncultured Pseudodesulfovibrio sp.]